MISRPYDAYRARVTYEKRSLGGESEVVSWLAVSPGRHPSRPPPRWAAIGCRATPGGARFGHLPLRDIWCVGVVTAWLLRRTIVLAHIATCCSQPIVLFCSSTVHTRVCKRQNFMAYIYFSLCYDKRCHIVSDCLVISVILTTRLYSSVGLQQAIVLAIEYKILTLCVAAHR